MTLYKSVLHNSNNTLPKWYLEAIGVYVSFLNDCDYCVAHHFAGFARLLNNDKKANQFFECVKKDALDNFFDSHYDLGIKHAKQLTKTHATITKTDIEALKQAGLIT